MANKTQTIRIESILGGISPSSHFSSADQYLESVGIDPGKGANELTSSGVTGTLPSGLIKSVSVEGLSTTTARVVWLNGTPKDMSLIYAYDAVGSVYSTSKYISAITGVGDLNDGGTASGNGMAYYDNYLYCARDTTVARYGPLNGTPTWTDDYWVTTLSKTALSNTTYPISADNLYSYPNHILHRHQNGKLYIIDVVDNQATLHFIQTSKTTVEGDTDAGSTYDAVNLGFNLWATAIESYGEQLVIGLYEGKSASSPSSSPSCAKIAFWDTTSASVNSITWNDFPDEIITAMKVQNGVLYIFSCNQNQLGFRVSRMVGSNTFETVGIFPSSESPTQGGVVSSSRLFFAGHVDAPVQCGCVWALGIPGLTLDGIHNVIPVATFGTPSGPMETQNLQNIIGVYATALANPSMSSSGTGINATDPLIAAYPSYRNEGTIERVTTQGNGVDEVHSQSAWTSQMFKIGKPFKITKIRIPLATALTVNDTLYVTSYIDTHSQVQTIAGPITIATHGTNTHAIIIRPTNLVGDDNFCLNLTLIGPGLTISLPIEISYELLDVDTVRP